MGLTREGNTGRSLAHQPPPYDDHIATMRTEHFSLKRDAMGRIAPGRPRVRRKPLAIPVAFRMHGAAIQICREREGVLAGLHPFLEVIHQHHAIDRRASGHQQQGMVATRIRSGDGPRGISSPAIRLQPFKT